MSSLPKCALAHDRHYRNQILTILALGLCLSFASPSRALSPNYVKNFTLKNGVYVSTPGWQKSIAALGFRTTLGPRQTAVVTFQRRITGMKKPSGNVKVWRAWSGSIGGNPNNYDGQPYYGWFFNYPEYVDGQTSTLRRVFPQWYVDTIFDGNWHTEERTIKFPTAVGRSDGRYTVRVDGRVALDALNWKVNDASSPAWPNYFVIQVDPSNWTPAGSPVVEVRNTVTIKIVL